MTRVANGQRLAGIGINAITIAAAVTVMILMLHTLANVFMRASFGTPVRATIEMVGYWYLPVIAFLGFIYAQYRESHIEATLLYDALPARNQKEVLIIGRLICAMVTGALAYYGWTEAIHNVNIRKVAGALEVAVWPATLLVPVVFAVLTLQLVYSAYKAWRTPEGTVVVPEGVDSEHVPLPRKGTPTGRLVVRLLLIASLAVCVALMFLPDSAQVTAIGAIAAMLLLLFLRVPVAFALMGPGLLGLYAVRPRAVFTMLEEQAYHSVSQWTLSVLPMFILMGLLLWKSGLTTQIYIAARQWLSWLPAGLGVSTTAAGAGLAAVSGSTIATTFALSRIGVPEMLRAGYDRRVAVGTIMVSGLPGQLIPPSTFLVVYAGIASVPIGPQLLAGVFPGMLVAMVFGVSLIIMALAVPNLVGRGKGKPVPSVSWSERWRSLFAIWPLPVLIGIVLGGMYTGFLTATEAGAAGAFGALLLTFWLKRNEAWGLIREAAAETVNSTGSIFLLIIGAEILSSLLTLSGIADGFTLWVGDAGFDRVQFLMIVMVAYLVLGTFMEPLPIMLLTVPLLIPTLQALDVSLIWFGVFAVFMGELAVLTPPVGILSFIVHGIVQNKEVNLGQRITLNDVLAAVYWIMPIATLFALILIFFPEIATWLPDSM